VHSDTVSQLDSLKLIYYEILDGYTYNPDPPIFVKHFTEKESHLLLVKKLELNKFYSESEVPTEKQLLQNALESGEWTQVKEDKILELKYILSDNEKLIHDIIPEQRGWIESQLAKHRKELVEIYTERKAVLGRSIEDLTDEDVDDFISYISCFKDEKLTIQLADSYDDFQALEISELYKYSRILSSIYGTFDEEKIKQLACMPFLLNKLSHCKEDVYGFFGKPLIELSHNQIHLISLGIKNLNTLNRAEGSPPDLNLEGTIQQVTSWYDMQFSMQLAKSKQSK
jgi:hypothetical protein